MANRAKQKGLRYRGVSMRFLKLAVAGCVLFVLLPPIGLLAMTNATWMAIVAAVALAIPILYFGYRAFGWPVYVALTFASIFFIAVTVQASNYRMLSAAEGLGPVTLSEVASRPDVEAFFISDLRYGPAEGWYEVCGEDSCTEYTLISLVTDAWREGDPIPAWTSITSHEKLDLSWAFEPEGLGSSRAAGIRRACLQERVACAANPLVFSSVQPGSGSLLGPEIFEIGGLLALFLWILPVFLAYLRGLYRVARGRD